MLYEIYLICHMTSCGVDRNSPVGLVFDDKAICESVARAANPPTAFRQSTYEIACGERHLGGERWKLVAP